MRTLKQDGIEKVLQGITDIQQVARSASSKDPSRLPRP
jgi:type II secretory ATPase GspE/PulE/Tfp pilus assembly ATPase PilB-like protein